MSTTLSPNMNLPVPTVGVEPGPAWATDVNNCMSTIDSHDHSSGKGVIITPAGLNISSDLSFINNNAIMVRTVRYQPGPTLGAADLAASYVTANGDFWYVNSNGASVQITNGSSLAGASGTISGLTAPASASYVSANSTFVWQSAANTAANLDAGSVILRNLTASSHGTTLSAHSSLAADYTITFPAAVPGTTNFLTMDTSGNIGNSVHLIGPTNLTPVNLITSSTCGNFSTTNSTATLVTNLSVTITTTGRPVWVGLISDGNGSGNNATVGVTDVSGDKVATGSVAIFGDSGGGTKIAGYDIQTGISGGSPAVSGSFVPASSVYTIDTPSAGVQTYLIKINADAVGDSTVYVKYAKLIAYEL